MNTSGTSMVIQPTVAARPRRTHSWIALFAKELREARVAIFTGLVIFWLVPAIWAFVFRAFSPREGVPAGLAWGLLAIAGWLYAVVVGAQTVCRDWGRPEEHFLLGRPVSPRQVIWTKLCAGLAVLLIVVLVVGAWDMFMATQTRDWQRTPPTSADVAAIILCAGVPVLVLLTTGFLIAFAAAVVTRQMLASAMLATMVLLIWVAAPLVSTRLEFLYPAWILHPVERSGWPGLPEGIAQALGLFLLVVMTAWGGLIGVALWAAPGVRSIHLGPKTLAWSMALVVLGLFAMAMGEVGNSLVVRDQTILYVQPPAVARSGRQFFVINDPISSGGTAIATFRVDEKGIIRDARQGVLAFPKDIERPQPGTWLPVSPELHVDEKGRLFVTAGPFDHVQRRVHRFLVDWPAGSDPVVTTAGVAERPAGDDQAPWWLTCAVSTSRYSYLHYRTSAVEPLPQIVISDSRPLPGRLCVFEWHEDGQARLIKEIPVRAGTWLHMVDGQLVLANMAVTPQPARVLEWIAFDANRPEELGTGEHWLYGRTDWLNQRDYSFPLDNRTLCALTGLGAAPGAISRNVVTRTVNGVALAYVGRQTGLRVREFSDDGQGSGRWRIVDEVSASPLAWVFRGEPEPLLLGSSTLIEQTQSGTIWYDITDPRHPRRAGFLNTATGMVYALEKYAVLFEDSLVTVVDLPAPGQPGEPVRITRTFGYITVGEEDPYVRYD